MTDGTRTVEHVTCLGCGCTCDDIVVVVRNGRIAEARNACTLGATWFGDGSTPAATLVAGRPASLDAALDECAAQLTAARRTLVFLSIDISCEAQRLGVAIADRLRGVADGVTSSTAAAGLLAAQRRGRVSASLGEVRNRADLLVFWGVDPDARYPRYRSRYAPDPAGLFTPGGRGDRTVVAVDIGTERGPADADLRVALTLEDELDAIAVLRASLANRPVSDPAGDLTARVAPLAQRLAAARYAVLIYDGEPNAVPQPARADALIALALQANASTRCSITPLRAGGNRTGSEAVLTWQTGFPMTVDFSRGFPRYRPDEGAMVLLDRREIDTMLIVGDPRAARRLPLERTRCIVIGPRASRLEPAPHVAIDTGVAGIHEGGTVFRMDDIPLPLRPSVPGPIATADVLRALTARLAAGAPPP